jgi:ABC transporter substrate binding protein
METCKISAGAFIAKGIVANTGAPAAVLEMREVQAAASTVGLATTTFKIRQTNDISTAIDALKDRAEALYGVSDPLVATNRNRLGILAVGAQLPTMHGSREHVEAGGLVSYGANFPALFRRGAEYVDKILRGAKPADIEMGFWKEEGLEVEARYWGPSNGRHCESQQARWSRCRRGARSSSITRLNAATSLAFRTAERKQ